MHQLNNMNTLSTNKALYRVSIKVESVFIYNNYKISRIVNIITL